MKSRELSKCREWEKLRRDKLNKGFTALSKLLPNYDPSLTLSKIDILQKAACYIEELQQKVKDMLANGIEKTEGEEINALSKHNKKLLWRNEQLTNLLKDAGIKIPSEYGTIKNFKEPLRWSNKITAEQAKEFAKAEAHKENKKESPKVLKKSKLKNGLKKSTSLKSRKELKKSVKKATKVTSKKSTIINVQLPNVQHNFNSSQPCFIIANNPPIHLSQNCNTTRTAPTVLVNSGTLTPKVTASVKPRNAGVVSKINTPLSSLGPGTLILANGNIVPLLPQSATVLPTPTILTNPTSVLLKPPRNNTTLIVVPNSKEISGPSETNTQIPASTITTASVTSTIPSTAISTNSTTVTTTVTTPTTTVTENVSTVNKITTTITTSTTASIVSTAPVANNKVFTKTFTRIRPKLGITRTTHVNKVPIPALASYSSNIVRSNLNAPKILTEKKNNSQIKKPVKSNKMKSTSKSSLICKETKSIKAGVTILACETVKDADANNTTKVDEEKTSNNENPISKEVPGTTDKKRKLDDISGNDTILKSDINSAVPSKLNKKTSNTINMDIVNENTNLAECDVNNLNSSLTMSSTLENCNQIDNKDKNINTNDTNTVMELDIFKKVPPNILDSQESFKTDKEQSSTLTKIPENNPKVEVMKDEVINKSGSKLIPVVEREPLNKCNTPAADTTCNNIITNSNTSIVEENVPHHEVNEIQEKHLDLGMNLNHSELSNDIFSSLQVPMGSQNPESTSPTAAFLLAFPLVSSLTGVKVTEVIEEENSDSRHGTPTLLQIGTMDVTKTTPTVHTETLTPNLLNLDSFSFFTGKDLCSNLYSTYDNSNNVYSFTSTQSASQTLGLETIKDVTCYGKEHETSSVSRHSKTACELQSQPRSKVNVPTCTSINNSQSSHNPLPVSNSEVLYSTGNNILSKSSTVAPNSFTGRQNTAVTYTKLSSVPTTYPHPAPIENTTNIHCDSRHKISHMTNTTCKDVVQSSSYSTPSNRKLSETLITSHYNNVPMNIAPTTQCNTFNPFSDMPKSTTINTQGIFSKSYNEPLYTTSTHYSYNTNNGSNFEQPSYYPPKPAVSKTNVSMYNTVNYGDTSYEHRKRDSVNQRHSVNYYSQQKTQSREKFAVKNNKTNNQPKPPINWMTSPDFRTQTSNTEYLVPTPFPKDMDYTSNSFYSSNSFVSTTHSYFNTTSAMYGTPEFQNTKSFNSSLPIITANSAQRNEYEENQFSWSPTKLPQFLETPHTFVSSTLPTLVGDLALGTAQPPYNEHKIDQGHVKPKETLRRSKVHSVNYDNNQSNFLSVSQLVENKTDSSVSTRVPNRRNNNGRNTKISNSQKGNKHSQKPSETKEIVEGSVQTFNSHSKLDAGLNKNSELKQNTNYMENPGWSIDYNKSNRHAAHKNPQSSYSAEALIGHPNQTDNLTLKQKHKQQINYASNKTLPIPTFLSDNIVPYFPPVEIPAENNFVQPNQNYHSFSTCVQNNTYTSNTYITTGASITSSYLQSSTLMPEFGSHDYTAIADNVTAPAVITSDKVIDNKHCNRNEGTTKPNINRTESQQLNMACSVNSSNNYIKKIKHKHSNDNNLPGIVDFGFLTMPSSINSPILPDDFHTHSNFLPPPTPSQLYSCKNSLYPKQTSDLNSGSLLPLPPVPVSRNSTQNFETSSTTGNISSSLTNFNLSAIFPEINKGNVPISGIYPEFSKNKNYNFPKNYLSNSVQVSSNNKIALPNYANTISTTFSSSN